MNSIEILPETFFDGLSLAHKLSSILDSFKLEEIHLFSYFSSLLFVYKGKLLEDWKYRFIIDGKGYPFSDKLNFAIQRHLQNGFISKQGGFYVLTTRGTDEFNKFLKLDTLNRREEYIDAACTTNIIVPYTQTLRALLNDPEIYKARKIPGRYLKQSDIYEKFHEISKAVGVPSEDLTISAVTWINYIIEKDKLEQSNES